MNKTWHLGDRGEADATDLLAAHELGAGFQLAFVFAADDLALGEVRRRLSGAAPHLCRELEPAQDLSGLLATADSVPGAEEHRPMFWLQAKKFEVLPWRRLLADLQRHREGVRHRVKGLLVVAGPPELLELVQSTAPDFWAIRTMVCHFKEKLGRIPPAANIRWLHLSDFHFETGEKWERREILRGLKRDLIPRLRAEGLSPHAVMVTGDLAWSGKRKEFEEAERCFEELAGALELAPAERWFLVPGNHDVDRGRIGPADPLVLQGLTSQEAISAILSDGPTMKMLGRRLEEFYAFTTRFLGAARGWREERPWRTDLREIEGVTVGVLQLNSAWAGGTETDRGQLLVGEMQVRQALDEVPDAFLTITRSEHGKRLSD